MKKAIFLQVILLPLLAFGQQNTYKLTVKLNGIEPDAKAYLVHSYGWTSQKVLDSAKVKNSMFVFTGPVTAPVETSVVIDHTGAGLQGWKKKSDRLVVYLEPGNILVEGTDSVKHASITGSKINTVYAGYYKQVMAPAERSLGPIAEKLKAMPDSLKKDKAFQNRLMDQLKNIRRLMDSLKLEYIKTHPDSYFSLQALKEMVGKNSIAMRVKEIDPLFKSLSPRIRNSTGGKAFAKKIDEARPTSAGALAPDFAQKDVNGRLVRLSDFRGRYVLVDFWASWCGPCRAENPNVVKAYDQYKDRGFTVLGVSLDNTKTRDAWLAAIKKDNLTWTEVSDLKGWNNAAAVRYHVKAIPQNFLIDPHGIIIAKNLRGNDLLQELQKIFPR